MSRTCSKEVSACAHVCVWLPAWGRGVGQSAHGEGDRIDFVTDRQNQCVVMVGVGMAGYLLLQPPSLHHVVGDWHGIGLLVGISYKLSDFSGWNSINA